MKNLHLISNAHIDPVWLWDMEEGISAALSTFRMAAVFCEEYGGLVFNHNEAVLYEWIEEMEPELFARIQRLVSEKKWHIMGGWYLQPDCNMPSGESIIRQMEIGRAYFKEKFGATPSTAINFDSFGHSRGLVQIMAKAGFDSYLFCRPGQGDCPLPADDFIWVGFDGSKIMAHRADTYGTLMGEAGKKIEDWIKENDNKDALKTGCVLWGVGNHGGGPSRKDLDAIEKLMKNEKTNYHISHSTPEAYFAQRKEDIDKGVCEPLFEGDLNAWAVGCYTSQIRIKQKHRELEGELAIAEKMLSYAVAKGLLAYPEEELLKAQKALLFCEFHDILPGTSIQSAEENSLRTLSYGLEIAGKCKRKAFFALMAGEKKACQGEYPILIYNPHPYPVEGDFTCEFQLANQNWTQEYAQPVITENGRILPSQVEKESCNMNLDWRKRVTFHATLKPSGMNRFSANIKMTDCKPDQIQVKTGQGVCWKKDEEENILFDNGKMVVKINGRTGLLDVYRVDGADYLLPGAGALTVMESDCDPWGMNRHSYQEEEGRFCLMDSQEGSRYSGTLNVCHQAEGVIIKSLRIIETGAVRTVVEGVFSYEQSQACIRYILPVNGSKIEMQVNIHWLQKGKFLKLEIPTTLSKSKAYSETAYGVMKQKADGEEKVFHRWCGFWDQKQDRAVTVLNQGNYGVDFQDGRMRISLLHSAVYSAHPIGERPLLVRDRYLSYIDQGEREFSFIIQAGKGSERMERVTAQAVVFQEAPMIVPAFPPGEGEKTESMVLIDDSAVVLTAFRKILHQNYYLLRLHESTGQERKVKVSFPALEIVREYVMKPFEVKTLKLIAEENRVEECGIFGE